MKCALWKYSYISFIFFILNYISFFIFHIFYFKLYPYVSEIYISLIRWCISLHFFGLQNCMFFEIQASVIIKSLYSRLGFFGNLADTTKPLPRRGTLYWRSAAFCELVKIFLPRYHLLLPQNSVTLSFIGNGWSPSFGNNSPFNSQPSTTCKLINKSLIAS